VFQHSKGPNVLKTSLLRLATLLPLFAAACAAGEDAASPPNDGESVQVSLTAIPATTRCVRFTAITAGREYVQTFDVTGLTSLNAPVRGLPSSQALSMTADAFAVACTALTPTTQATWLTSLPVAVTITPGVVPTVSFVLRPAGGVNGDVDFLFLAATPSTRAYPASVVGTTSAQAFTIQNIGPAATGVLAVSMTGTGASQFVIGANTCTASLAVNATCSITVTFTPTTAGAKAANVVITGTPGGTIGVPLSGTGVQPAVLALTPASQSYGTVAIGKSSPLVTYTLTNSGGPTTVAPTLTSSDATFAISSSTCGDILAQAATCTFKVAFTPTAAATKTATLTATAGTVTATASATGVGALAPAITLTPSAVAFGTLLPGTSAQQMVTVKNVGGFPLSGLSFYLGGASTAPYTLGSGCGPGDLPPNATCTFYINANPTDPGTANLPANATVLVTAGGANPASVMGTVSGTVSWPLQPNPTSFHFGSVKVGTTSSVVIRFTNISPTGAPAISPLNFTTGTSAFTVLSSSCGLGYGPAPGSFCDVTVRYNVPTTANVMSIDSLRATPIPGLGPLGVSVTLRGVSAP
jgi:hypothetical protein